MDITTAEASHSHDILICSAGQYNLAENQYSEIAEPLKKILLGRIFVSGSAGLLYHKILQNDKYQCTLSKIKERNSGLLFQAKKHGIAPELYTDFSTEYYGAESEANTPESISIRFLMCICNKQTRPREITQGNLESFICKCQSATQNLGVRNLLWRLNTGQAAKPVLKLLQDGSDPFIIRGYGDRMKPEQWLDMAEKSGLKILSRPWKNIYIGKICEFCKECRKPLTTVFRVTERLADGSNGKSLNTPQLEVEVWHSNLAEEASTIIDLYYSCKESSFFTP